MRGSSECAAAQSARQLKVRGSSECAAAQSAQRFKVRGSSECAAARKIPCLDSQHPVINLLNKDYFCFIIRVILMKYGGIIMARQFISNPDYPVVETQWGKVKGFLLDGTFTFQGIQYAKAQRFHMPEDLEPWEGVKEATNYGCIAPTMGNPIPSGEILIPHRYWPENETCQFLNVWTRSLDKDAKKPVVVWFHGGGYNDGSSLEQVAYEGDALAEYGDVVVVTVNHRLNILGFLDLSAYGEEYENSANAGIADLVAALKWVNKNIAGFGGDPENVLIFGQSGGGGKVCTLLQTPAAAGLFHKAILMSGGAGFRPASGVDPREVVDAMLKALGFEDVHQLEKIPYSLLVKAYYRACRKTGKQLQWSPKANGWYLGHPVQVGFSDYAKKVPTIVTSVISEFGAFLKDVDPAQYFNGHDKEIGAAFDKAYPDKAGMNPAVAADRNGVVNFLKARAASDPETPGFGGELALVFDVNGGTPAWHCADIPFVFHNAYRVGNCNIEGVTDKIEDDIAGALVAFARTGDPNHEGMVHWAPFTSDCYATMVFDRETACRVDHDAELRELLAKYAPVRAMRSTIPEEDEEETGRAWLY